MTRLVGLSGYARSGKDTAAQALVDLGWRRDAFGDRLRDFLLALNPIVDIDVWEDEYDPSNYGAGSARLSDVIASRGWERAKDELVEVRQLLQRCGTDAGRKVLGDDVWVNAVIDRHLVEFQPLVIADVRFPNEAKAVKDSGGVIVRIERPGIGPKASPDGSVHVSETALDDWPFDAVVTNNGTPETLGRALLGWLSGRAVLVP